MKEGETHIERDRHTERDRDIELKRGQELTYSLVVGTRSLKLLLVEGASHLLVTKRKEKHK